MLPNSSPGIGSDEGNAEMQGWYRVTQLTGGLDEYIGSSDRDNSKKERQSPPCILEEGRGLEMGTNVGESVKMVQGITSPAGCSRVGPATDGLIALVPSQGLF